MKQHLLSSIRRLGLLGFADQLHGLTHRLRCSGANRRFHAQHPDYPLPPASLAFEAYGHSCWDEYKQTGAAHARLFATLVRQHSGVASPKVAEWGCGCARILRHLPAAGLDGAALTGIDVDCRAIVWCREHFPGFEFLQCSMQPTLALADDSFDAIYHYSVWTHLSPASVRLWAVELARILRPGGVMIGTTHGDRYQSMLLADERKQYQAGRPVVRQGYREGRKYFLTFYPPSFVRSLLQDSFRQITLLPPEPDAPQDVWLTIK